MMIHSAFNENGREYPLDPTQLAKINENLHQLLDLYLPDVKTPDSIGGHALKIENGSSIARRDWDKLHQISKDLANLFIF